MTEEKVQELLKNLRGLTYFADILGKKERFSVIAREGYDKVENVIRQFLLADLKSAILHIRMD